MSRGPIQLTISDYPRLVALWEAAGLPYKPAGRDAPAAFERQLAGGTVIPLGIETADGDLVGVALATHDGRKGWINRLAVHPAYRRQGLATRLIAAAEQVLHAQGIEIVAALIEPDNEASLALFLSAGYVAWPGIHYVTKRQHPEV